MKVHNKILKAFGALLIAALLFAVLPAGKVKADTSPTMDSVSPGEGAIVLSSTSSFVLTVDADDIDGDLAELEIDHSMENNSTTPEFSVYADESDPYGGEETQFAAAGVTVTYDATDMVWTIDFGSSVTNAFVTNGGITFYLVLKDVAGNQWGSMNPTTTENTFAYTITRDETLPTLESVSPAAGEVVLSADGTFVWVVDALDAGGNLYELEIDHSMENNPNTPEFSVYADEEDPYGGDGDQFAAAGVTVTYDATDMVWTIDFGSDVTDEFVANDGITFYVVLKDDVGNQWGSMNPTTTENTFAYTITRDETLPTLESESPAAGEVVLSADGTFVWVVDALDEGGNLYELEIDHSMEATFPQFSVYADESDPYGGDGDQFSDAGVTVTYDATEQVWVIDFGTEVTQAFLNHGGITFYLVLKDAAGNQWGSMYEITPENTFAYTLTQDTDLPVLESVSPAAGTVYLADGDSFVLTVDAYDASDNLYELEIDHSMEATFPQFSVYADEEDPYGGDGNQFSDAGVTVTYDATEQVWVIDFGTEVTQAFLNHGGITFYLVLKDAAGNQWGSMYEITPENTFAYSFVEANDGDTITLDGDVDGNITILTPWLTILLKDGTVVTGGSPCFTVNADNTRITTESIGGAVCLPAGGVDGIVVGDGLTNITIEGLEIDGKGTAVGHGIDFLGDITNTVITNNYIHGMVGDGVHFNNQPSTQSPVSFYIQGNLFKDNTGVGVYNGGTTAINAEFNSWGDALGATITNVDAEPFTHVDLYMVSTNPDVDNWPNQVFVDEDITYQVKAHMVNVTAAAFEFSYPTDLLGSPTLGNITTSFEKVPEQADLINVDDVNGVISFDGYTGLSGTPVSGDIVLFEVTFTATSTPGTATLDFNEETDEFSMVPLDGEDMPYGPSNNIYADELEDATLNIITRPTLTADGIEGPYVAGISQEINIETCNAETGGDWSESVASPNEPDTIAWLRITDVTIGEIARLQFLYDGEWFDFDVQDAYGGDAVQQDDVDVIARFGNYNFGMEIPVDWCDYDAFRVTFVEPGFHDITIELYDMMDTPQNYIGGDDILLTSLGPVTIEVLGNFDVTGTIAMQGRTVRSGVPLTLTDVNGEPTYGPINTTSTSELAYNVLFPAGVNGSIYEITTNQARYLNVHDGLDKQFLVNGDYTIDALELKGGNAVWENHASSNNKIDIYDASEVGTYYGSSGDQDADVNFDGKVSIQDLALVGGNFDLTSAEAYADWLTPEYNGSVSGIVTDDGAGNISGSVSGDYNLSIVGAFDGPPEAGFADFTGTVSGDFTGTITGTVYERGTDPLYATITGTGADETVVRLVGAFVKSGIDGHFKGQIITGPELDPVNTVTITGDTTVAVGETINLDVTTDPADRWVIWSVHANDTAYASIDQNGILTGLAESPGAIEIIVVVIDDSGFSSDSHWVTVTAP